MSLKHEFLESGTLLCFNITVQQFTLNLFEIICVCMYACVYVCVIAICYLSFVSVAHRSQLLFCFVFFSS